MNRSYKLLGILQSYAPDAAAQQRCTALHNDAYLQGATDREVEVTLVGALNDGLRYGNWPWTRIEEA